MITTAFNIFGNFCATFYSNIWSHVLSSGTIWQSKKNSPALMQIRQKIVILLALNLPHLNVHFYSWDSRIFYVFGAATFARTSWSVWPDWAIFCTLGNFFKPLETINLPKSLTFLGNFCKGVKILNFSSEIIFGQLLQTFGNFYLVTLVMMTTLLPNISLKMGHPRPLFCLFLFF